MPKSNVKFVDEVFSNHHQELSRYLVSKLRGEAVEPTDVAQETYLRLLRVKDTSVIRNPHAYLFTVASHVMRELGIAERKHCNLSNHMVEQLPDNKTIHSPEDQVDTEQQLKQLIEQMTPIYTAVLILRKQQGLSHQEIATKLGISTHTVKKYLFRALTFCREHAAQVRGESQ